jgi:hypothetical protein
MHITVRGSYAGRQMGPPLAKAMTGRTLLSRVATPTYPLSSCRWPVEMLVKALPGHRFWPRLTVKPIAYRRADNPDGPFLNLGTDVRVQDGVQGCSPYRESDHALHDWCEIYHELYQPGTEPPGKTGCSVIGSADVACILMGP